MATAQAGGNEMVPAGHLRATHDDRNRVVELLRVAAGDGRLTLEELGCPRLPDLLSRLGRDIHVS